MAFCSTVGQAIFQTAGAIGPSTIERSKSGAFGLEPAVACRPRRRRTVDGQPIRGHVDSGGDRQ